MFSQSACDTNTSCGGIPNFLIGYGVLFSLILAAWVGYGRLKPDTRRTNQHRVAMLIGLAALPPAMILIFFTGAETLQAGALTRLLEWPTTHCSSSPSWPSANYDNDGSQPSARAS